MVQASCCNVAWRVNIRLVAAQEKGNTGDVDKAVCGCETKSLAGIMAPRM